MLVPSMVRNRRPPTACPLEGMSTQPLVGLSITRRLKADYTGPLIQVKRASDSATLDVGCVGRGIGFLDVEAVRAFCSGTTGNIAKVYEQYNGHDYVQATLSVEPTIYTGGDLVWIGGMPFMTFDGSDDGLTNSNIGLTASTSPALTMATVMRRNAGGNGNTYLNIGGNSSSGKCFVYSFTTSAAALSFSGSPQDIWNVTSTSPVSVIMSHAANANLNACALRSEYAAQSPASTQSATMSLQNASSRWGSQVNSVGAATLDIAANSNCLILINADITSGRDLECLEQCLAQHRTP